MRLEGSRSHAQVPKDISLTGPASGAVRGAVAKLAEDKNNKGNNDRGSQEVPLKMEVPLAGLSSQTAEEYQVEFPRDAKPKKTTGLSLARTDHRRQTQSSIKISQRPSPERTTQIQSVSPQESLRTIIVLDTPGSSDDESDISPLSDDRPSAATRSGAALRRFFPELSSNTLALVSPMGADASADRRNPGLIEFPSIFETELQERVQTLYKNSVDADQVLGPKTGSSMGSGSEDVFDCASSCYSRRSSLTSVGTECRSSAAKELDRYSIPSPVAAGVFDDSASACPSRVVSRAPSFASAVPSGTLPSSDDAASSIDSSGPTPPSRCKSTSSGISLNDFRNKPLPLEPVQEPSPLAIRRNDHTQGSKTDVPRSRGMHSTYRHHHLSRSTPSMHWKQSGQACQSCGECAGGRKSGDLGQSRWGRRSEWLETSNGQRLRHIPTLAQAAEELEFALAGLARDPHMQQRTLLVLDGPLQISRHNGDLVATRPAPLPPSTKPHSQAHPSKSFKKNKRFHTKVNPFDDAISPRSATLKALRSTKERPSPHLPDKESQNKDEAAPKETKPPKTPNTPQVKGEAKLPLRSASAISHSNDDFFKTPKMKKSFTLTMPSFRRTRHTRASTLQEPRLSVVLSSRSETSLLDPHASTEVHPNGPPRLPSHSDPNLDLNEDLDAGTASKRDDLLLQLPRLQTQDLGLKISFEPLSVEKEVLALIQTQQQREKQPQLPQPQQPKQWRGAAPSFCAPGPTQTVQHQHPPPGQAGASPRRNAKMSTLQLRITPPEDEKMLVASELVASEWLRQSQAFVSTAQASSVQLPPEQIYELAATPPSPSSSMPAMFMEQPHMPVDFPIEMPDHLVVLIMGRIDSLDDLFNFVLVNKRFYQIFKRRELFFIKRALFRMSPPAWELREMSPPWKNEWQLLLEPDTPLPEYTPESYLNRYACDIYTLAQLKSMILVRCSAFLRRDTVKGLSGVDIVRAEEVDDAFWRIWTFCRIFGSGKGRENDLEGQVDWLKGGPKARSSFGASSTVTEPFGMNNVLFEPPEGFARGNSAAGLSAKQLYDMTEIWTCLGVLLQPLHGKCVEARNAGIFQGLDIPEGDTVREETALEEWTSYVLTLGLSAVLTLSSLCPAEATAATFSKAQSNGLTKWEPTETETSRSSFLKEAVSRVYEGLERSFTFSSPKEFAYPQPQSFQRRKQFQEELRTRRLRGPPSREGALGTSFADERPMSEFSTIVHNLNGTTPRNALPVPPVPAPSFDRLSSSIAASVGPRSTSRSPPRPLTPETNLPIPRSPPLQPVLAPQPLRPQVQDPVDRAISRMVNELGFNQDDVKWALKITDTGEGIDVDAAEQLLKQQKRKHERNPFAPRGKDSLLKSVMKHQRSQESGWRFA
ncbi:hypothetical protein F1880_008218 [Penicillium rolfsii]|nr:hypothetical protein F1880_008218 [Penicillium rolfsii]